MTDEQHTPTKPCPRCGAPFHVRDNPETDLCWPCESAFRDEVIEQLNESVLTAHRETRTQQKHAENAEARGDRLEGEAKAHADRIITLTELITELVDFTSCEHDERGGCTVHGYTHLGTKCPHAAAQEITREWDDLQEAVALSQGAPDASPSLQQGTQPEEGACTNP